MDIVGEYTRGKGAVTEDMIRQKVAEASNVVVRNVMQRLGPQLKQAGLPAPQPGAIPAASAAAPAEATADQGEEVPHTPELQAAVDAVIEAFLEDVEKGVQTGRWVTIAKQRIPAEVLASISPLTQENLQQFAFEHGSPEVVTKAVVVLTKLGAESPEEHAVADQIAEKAAVSTGGGSAHNPSVPVESSVDIFDQDADEDEEPAAPVQPVPVQKMAKPKKRGRPRKA
jgi:hypothetical protein